MIDEEFEQVKEFHKAFGVPVSDKAVLLTKERVKSRSGWMIEEINEFIESENIYDQADAMIDLIYFALGTLVEMGVKPKNLFDIVQSANMGKLWEDGQPRFRENDGKIIKPKGWQDPYPKIKDAIDKMG